ncbi:28S ribosomal protein S9, mitochondrial isoform X2 [Toxorhynchites rutilus septentrionalis]|uniref:28S ribosomal protein S9, mitochondrial isoform X2 n=1 Tax=Toxorhynchites rutilus septentrionalis TaxID=329112 RepID=UPI0024798961|nr:28S ribosomal protein S9, mitochondrial isoform X2 [Toxorhynchites rutilus septentrionalis]
MSWILGVSSRFIRSSPLTLNNLLYCTTTSTPKVDDASVTKQRKISKAMKSYLERARGHDEFMKVQNLEYNLGKRHLANMMGEDPETFNQDQIDEAIEYLFPSGLYDKKAQPMMKTPADIIPQRKAAEFDETGRPYHSLFFTGRPNYYKLLFDIHESIHSLNEVENRIVVKHVDPDLSQKLSAVGSEWISKNILEKKLLEDISDKEYENFVNAMSRLMQHPISYTKKYFIENYRKPLLTKTHISQIPKPHIDENGRSFITVYECLRKSARGDVTVYFPGTGKISVNGQDITYFEDVQSREQVKRAKLQRIWWTRLFWHKIHIVDVVPVQRVF